MAEKKSAEIFTKAATEQKRKYQKVEGSRVRLPLPPDGTKEENVSVILRMPDKLKWQAKAKAAKLHSSFSAYVRDLIIADLIRKD
ncbi:MAG: hypothetical protein LBL67_04370 [Coriobacteriales bacterium]|jgi:MoxR-like ATPase|nr:hypothetical protein [Coriobacteriales bacterium]